MTRYVIFLGAGASAAEGAPVQHDLFTTYFAGVGAEPGKVPASREVANFFQVAFGIDVADLPSSRPLPTFEEVLGLIDLAMTRRESLHGVPLDTPDVDGLDLRSLRRSLVLVMADAIRRRVVETPTIHRDLVAKLRDGGRLQETSFITTNYDTLIDDALYDHAVSPGVSSVGPAVDYGFEALGPRADPGSRKRISINLLKVHGSLNWLHCPACTDLVVTHGPDIVARLLHDIETARCTHCDTMREPVIVPPTYYKDLSNVYLGVVWNRAARVLRECSHLIFCGYSLPDADMHIKYLVKTGQMNRLAVQDRLRITLVNHHPAKKQPAQDQEIERYRRLFGEAVVDARLSFEDFALDPGAIVGRPRH